MLPREVRDLLANAVGFAPSHEVRRQHSPAPGPSVTLVNPSTMAPPDGSSPPDPSLERVTQHPRLDRASLE